MNGNIRFDERSGVRSLKFLIDILRPAHVHFFHHFIRECEQAGHRVLVTARRQDLATELLEAYGHPYQVIHSPRDNGMDLVWELLLRNRFLQDLVHRERPDLMLGVVGISIAAVGKKMGIPAIVFCDTEASLVSNWLTFPRAKEVITPRSFTKKVRGNHVTYPGYHELAYLHPNRFTPDPAIRRVLGIAPEERFSIVRFVSWSASQDFFQRGFSPDGKRRLVEALLGRGRVFVSAEGALPPEFEALRLKIPPLLVHHAIAAADLLVGESATMASEAAVLGTPAVSLLPVGKGFTGEEERRYGLVCNVRTEAEAITAAEGFLDRQDREAARAERAEKRRRLLEENVDVTGWILDHLGIHREMALPERAPKIPEGRLALMPA